MPKLREKERVTNLGFRGYGFFRIRQDLAKHQIDAVATGSNDSSFFFHNLSIKINGEGFESFDLDFPSSVQKGQPYRAQDECDFVFASIAEEQRKLIKSGGEASSEIAHLDRGEELSKKDSQE